MRKSLTIDELARIDRAATIVGDKYNLLIFMELIDYGEKSFNELKRMTGINQVTLTKKLRELEALGMVNKTRVSNEVHYQATAAMKNYAPVVHELSHIALQE